MSSPLGYEPSLDRPIDEEDPAQQSLRDRQLRTLFETALDGMAIADDQGHYLDVNPAACELFGLERDKLLGRCMVDFAEPGFNFQQVWQEFQQQEKMRGEFRLVRVDGDIRIVEYAATANFLPHRHLSVMRDITERKQAEAQVRELTQQLDRQVHEPVSELEQTQAQLRESQQRLESILNSIEGVVWSVHPETFETIYINPAVEQIFGCSMAEFFANPNLWFEIIHPDDRSSITNAFVKLKDLGKTRTEYRIVRRDGQVRWLSVNSYLVYDETGTPIRIDGITTDITDRIESESRLEQIARHIPGVIYQFRQRPDGTFHFPYSSEGMREIYGVSPEEVREDASKVFGFLHPDDIDLVSQSILESAEHLTPWYCEYRACLPDGRMLWLVANSTPQREPDGSTIWHGYIRDISDRKQAEALLEQSQKRYETLAEASPIGVFLTDAKGDCLYVNQTWLQTTGLTKEEALGPDWAQTLHPEDRERVFKEWYETALIKQPFQSEYRFLRLDSSVAWVIGQALPLIDNEGEIEGYVGTITDITDRKRQEQALRLIVEGTAAKTGEAFFKSCVQYLAQVLEVRYALIAEFVDSEKSIAKTLAFWAEDDFGDNFTYNLAGAPCEHSQADFCLYRSSVQSLFPKDNDLVVLQVESYSGLPILDAAGNCLGLLVVMDTKPMEQNIEMQSAILRIFATRAGAEIERIKAEAAVRQSEIQLRLQSEELETTLKKLQNTQTQLIQSEKMSSLGQLVAGIAHEINNPVSFIYGNIQPASDYASNLIELIRLYQEHYPSPPQAISEFIEEIDLEYLVSDFYKLFNSIENGATRISNIVKSLRTFSHLDESSFKAVDLHDNIESTLVILQNWLNGRAGKPEITVVKNYGNLPPIECYGSLLNQVFMNLLVNAIDAIEQQRDSLELTERWDYIGCITITTSIYLGNQVFISIQDNGCGMNSEIQEKIFNPFFTTKPVGKGTGMGLATSYQIVNENHRGRLRCCSAPGEGTEFVIELPVGKQK